MLIGYGGPATGTAFPAALLNQPGCTEFGFLFVLREQRQIFKFPFQQVCHGSVNFGVFEKAASVTDDDTNANLKGWWKFDDESGTSANDSSTAGNDGVVSGADWTTGQVEGALNFNGSSDYVSIENVDANSAPITICAWIKADTWETNIWEGTIVGKHDWVGGSHGYSFRCGDNGSLSFVIGDGSNWAEAASTSLMSTGTWYHVAGVYDQSYVRVFINGDEKDTTAETDQISASEFRINVGRGTYATDRLFDGVIDEIRIYNDNLSESEVNAIYQVGL